MSPELYQRIEEARGQTPRERFCREAVEVAVELIEDRAVEAATASPAPVSRPGRRSPASAATPAYIGCAAHPTAGAVENSRGVWCAEPACTNYARAVAR